MSSFPKHVYKRGTAKPVPGSGEEPAYTAESALVSSEAQLKALEGEWCDSPAEAAKAVEKKEAAKK